MKISPDIGRRLKFDGIYIIFKEIDISMAMILLVKPLDFPRIRP